METAHALRRAGGLGWAGFVLVAAWWLTLAPFPDRVIVAGNDLAFVVAGAVAAVVVARRAARFTGRRRLAWSALAAGLAGWAAGQVVRSLNELVLQRTDLFPSWADAGYLLLPVGAGAALLLYPVDAGVRRPIRRVLDGLIVSGSLVQVWWITALSAVATVEGVSQLAVVAGVAHPLLDVALLSTTVLVRSRSRSSGRPALTVLTAGLAALAVADITFGWLSVTGAYRAGSLVDLPWFVGFALMALAAGLDRDDRGGDPVPPEGEFTAALLPYVPFGIAIAVTVARAVLVGGISPGDRAGAGVLLVLVLARQFLTVHENRDLARSLSAREHQLRHQAFHDALTGLANRELLTDRVAHALSLRTRDLAPMAVLFIDLDDFKLVNDTLGHTAGDTLLVQVAERLQRCLRPGDTIARLGGDEFAVLLETGNIEATLVASRLLETVSEPFDVAGHAVAIQASIGVVELAADDDPVSADTLLAHADLAMYAAKRDGKARMRVFSPDLESGQGQQLRLRAQIADAVRSGAIDVAYQPVFDLETGLPTGAEALARWRGPDGPVSPAVFVPLIESAGLGRELSHQTIARVTRQLGTWNTARGDTILLIGINLTADQLTDPELLHVLHRDIERHGVRSAQLVLEITESSLLSDLRSAATAIDRLRASGFKVALDDFGTGYSSMTHLVGFNLDYLKIDRSFVDPLPASDLHTRFVRGLLALAREIGLATVAEGIETTEQLAALQALGCTRGQGYLLSRPVPAAEVEGLMLDALLATTATMATAAHTAGTAS